MLTEHCGSCHCQPSQSTHHDQGQGRHVVSLHVLPCSPGPAVVPPTAARALLKKVAMFCSLAVGGRPPT